MTPKHPAPAPFTGFPPGFKAKFERRFDAVCPEGEFIVTNDPLFGDRVFTAGQLWNAMQSCGDPAWVNDVLTVLGLV